MCETKQSVTDASTNRGVEADPGDGRGLSSYQKRLLVFLSVATFFEGYDFFALTQILPELSSDPAMQLSRAQAGQLVGFTSFGTMVAFLLVRRADHWGRKRVLTVTIAGYTLCTFLTGFSPNIWVFALLQFFAKIFLIAEWATSMVYAAEEFPAASRGAVIGVIQAFSSLGSIACAGVAPLLLATAYGWRSVYFVGVVPLLMLVVARRGLRESRRFDASVAAKTASRGMMRIWKTVHRRRLLQLGAIWALTYLCTHNAVTFWKFFVMAERGFSKEDVAKAIMVAALGAMPMVFYAGKLIDRIGRKKGAVVIFGLSFVGVVGSYSAHGFALLTGFLMLGIFGASAVLPVLNAFTTELFPTELRGDAYAWANNILGRVGYVLSPALVGLAAEHVGWGRAVRFTAAGPLLALLLIVALLPETGGKSLEETAGM